MKILIINSGSSSIKFQVIVMPQGRSLCKGIVERLGQENGHVRYEKGTESLKRAMRIKDHKSGLGEIMELLKDPSHGVLEGDGEIDCVGHRVVHGGDAFSGATEISDAVLEKIKALSFLAPLHNPANAIGIEVAQTLFPKAKQVAVFDTAFHQSIPPEAHVYAIPKKLTQDHGIRVYGFHGTSHKYVSEKAIAYLGKPESKIITVHLGNGSSITAVKDGKSIEHSLGFGPSNGLIMGTRSGDIDQSVVFFLMDSCGMDSQEVNTVLQKESGLLGLTGHSDLREIQRLAEEGDKDCLLALEMISHRIKKYIGAYIAILNGVDAIVFTAGIGENSVLIRQMSCTGMEAMGIVMESERNASINTENEVSEFQGKDSRVRLLVIPTNEELEIARQCHQLLGKG
ncbi:acetate kinase [Muricauda sp. SCSIO 64092]|uniref:acetate/propionate family kinase n=1 Tax=Allomuricauda sp. SCSIO 64092 TaxID=2908842 RepID=UPI001FF4C128|nr:acetate kinase [Muricauda sp. SCSIO 64092]UOY08454.1 acetate kinase [Muricauda sp. SCSIO 64092]